MNPAGAPPVPPPVPPDLNADGGRGRGRGGGRGDQNRGGRGRGRGRSSRSRGGGRRQASPRKSSNRPTGGNSDSMHGHVFELPTENEDKKQFLHTLAMAKEVMQKEYKNAEDLMGLFADPMVPPVIVDPARPARPNTTNMNPDETVIAMEDYQDARARYNALIIAADKRREKLASNTSALWALIWGQCSDGLRAKLRTLNAFSANELTSDVHWLLTNIKTVMNKFDEARHVFSALIRARKNFYNTKQGDMTDDEYLSTFIMVRDVIESYNGNIGEHYTHVGEFDEAGNARTEAQRTVLSRDRTLAALFLANADPRRYALLNSELSNSYAMGVNNYPTDLTAAYALLQNYERPNIHQRQPRNDTNRHIEPHPQAPNDEAAPPFAFAQVGIVAGRDGVMHDGITCFRCQGAGHYANQCPSEITLAQYGVIFTNTHGSPTDASFFLPDSWVLLDSQSTISIFKNRAMLNNIRPADSPIRLFTNGGVQDAVLIGDIPNLGAVYFNQHSMANILSLAQVRRVCRVTFDSSVDNTITVYRQNGSRMFFREHETGLYVHDTQDPNYSSSSVAAYNFLNTVSENKKNFTARQVQGADKARDLYRKIGRPSQHFFELILRRNLIHNCPITVDDAKRALIIYGPDIATLKGKTVRGDAAKHVPAMEYVSIPAPILHHHSSVVLCADFFFVQGKPFLHTISRAICFRTVAAVPDRTKKTIVDGIRSVVHRYTTRGFNVTYVHADLEFMCVQEEILPAVLRPVAVDAHVPEVERSIRTIKERQRCTVHGLPFKRIPTILGRAIISNAVRNLNSFPAEMGVSDTLSPSTIMTGRPAPDFNEMKLEIGSYVQVFEDETPTNTQRARTLGAITMEPLTNAADGVTFMSLATGQKITRKSWDEIPMTDLAIARVEALAVRDGNPPIQESGMLVEWRPDHPIDDDEYDDDYVQKEEEDEIFDVGQYETINVDLGQLNNDDIIPSDSESHDSSTSSEPDTDDSSDSDPDNAEVGNQDNDDTEYEASDEDKDDEHEEQGAEHLEETVDEQEPPPRYGLRPRRTRDYSHRLDHAMDEPANRQSYEDVQFSQVASSPVSNYVNAMDDKELHRFVFGVVMTQMSATKGIKKHGRAAELALMKELMQLKDKSVFEPRHASSLTKDEKKEALREISLIKEKRSGDLKGRTVADGSTQRDKYDRSETTSPTISSDALFLTIMIDALEGRDVATADVAGAYLNAFMRDVVIMRVTGKMVDVMCEVNPEYRDFVVMEGKIQVLYLQLVKALYGCVQSALLWYELFVDTLQDMGFVLNPYEPCVANAVIDGSQCTVAWYVDDNKVSHKDPAVVSQVLKKIEKKFGKMTVTRGKKHTFLGMNIEYKDEGTATVEMDEYLKDAVRSSGLNVTKHATTPAKKDLLEVNDKSEVLEKDEAERFHSTVAKLLYIGMRGRMDIMLAVGFLCTRVSKCTTQDRDKLKRVLEYINGSLGLRLTIGADSMERMQTWIDASYAVHNDMKSHTGGVISFGTGGLVCKSTKQKLNTKSSTEAELVGVSDYIPYTIWVQLFLKEQGYTSSEHILHQDNESAIRLAKNGRSSAGKHSRHIDIRYFFIKDRIKTEGISIRHCPTEQMLADFFTKPLQGSLFRKFRNVILGYEHTGTLTKMVPVTHEERVEDRVSPTPTKTTWSDVVRTKAYKGQASSNRISKREVLQLLKTPAAP